MGLPLLVAVPAGEATGIVEADGAGITVTPESPAALADAVRRLAGDKDLCRSLGAASLAAAPLHSRQFQANAMMNVLTATVAGDGARAARNLAAADGSGHKAPKV